MGRAAKTRRFSKNIKKVLLAAVSSWVLASTSTAGADGPAILSKSFEQATEVPDAVLAEMRGRFVRAGRVTYFGVEMLTQWQTSIGEVFLVGLDVGVDWNNPQSPPTVSIKRTAQEYWREPEGVSLHSLQLRNVGTSIITDGAEGETNLRTNAAATGEIRPGGTANISGVAQIIQITGDGNRAHNDVMLDIAAETKVAGRVAPALSTPVANQFQPGAASARGAMVTSAEAAVTVEVARGNLRVAITVPGQGRAAQSINNLIGIRQNIELTGSMNNVINSLNMTVRLQRTSGVNLADLRSTLRGLMELRQHGMH